MSVGPGPTDPAAAGHGAPAGPERSEGRGAVGRATLVIAVATAISKVIGFGRDAVIASVFGASSDLDAYYVAQGVPNLAVGLVGSAAATALIPSVSRGLAAGRQDHAHRTALGVLVAVTAVVGTACLVLAVAADEVVALMAPGFGPDERALAVDLTRVLLVSAAFVSAMNILSAVLQAHRRFLVANLVGVPFNVAMIVAAVAFGGDEGVLALAVGFVVGSALRVVFLVPDLRHVGLRLRGRRRRRDPVRPDVVKVLALAVPLLLASGLSNVNSIVDRIVGSGQEEGTISALTLGFRLLMIPHVLLVVSFAQAALPTLSAADGAAMDRMVRRGVAALATVLAPVAALAVALAGPGVALAYGRGSFDGRDVVLVQQAVAGYAVGVAALGLREYLNRCHVARDDTRTPMLAAAAGVVVNVVGDLVLGRRYGVPGLAASTTASFLVALLVTGGVLVRQRPGLRSADLLRPLATCGAAAVVAGGVAWAASRVLVGPTPATLPLLLATAACAAVGLAVYTAVLAVGDRPLLLHAAGAMGDALRRRRGQAPSG